MVVTGMTESPDAVGILAGGEVTLDPIAGG